MLTLMAAAAVAATSPTIQAADTGALTSGTVLEVVAEGQVKRVPDIAIIRAGVVTRGGSASQAMTENAQRMAQVMKALQAAGVAPRDIQTSTISLSPQYQYGDNQPPVLTGYQASNNVSIRFRDLKRSGTILDTLVKQGANQIDGPSLTVDQSEAAQDEARVDAVSRARQRADLYAKTLGMKVDRILYVSEAGDSGVSGPMPRMMAEAASAKDSTEVQPGEVAITQSVRVRFLLN